MNLVRRVTACLSPLTSSDQSLSASLWRIGTLTVSRAFRPARGKPRVNKPLWYSHIDAPNLVSGTGTTADSIDYNLSLILECSAEHIRWLVVQLHPRNCFASAVFALTASGRFPETIRLVARARRSGEGAKKMKVRRR